MKSKFSIASGVIASATLLAFIASPANAASSETPSASYEGTSELVEEMEAFLTSYGGDPNDAESLVTAFVAGEPIDAMSSVTSPVSIEHETSEGFEVEVRHFADGSIAVVRSEIPTSSGGIGPMAISGCTVTNNGSLQHRTNCLVDFWYGLIMMSFRADYTYVTPGYDRIDRVYGASYTIGGACSTNINYFGVIKKYENASGHARARLDVQATMCPIAYTTTFFLELRVGAGGASFTYG